MGRPTCVSIFLRASLGVVGLVGAFNPLSPQTKSKKLPNVVIAPAQFGVPKDYDSVRAQLLARGHAHVVVCPLRRFDWLKILPSVVTPEFWTGTLKPTPTLSFFYDALDAAFDAVEDADGEADVSVVGHSIGGWVIRAYLGERGKHRRVNKIVTLGTPHNTPGSQREEELDNVLFAVDQTRGLLDYINTNFPPASNRFSETCVVGNVTSTAASFAELVDKPVWDDNASRSPLLESLVALPSYAVLGATNNPFKLTGDGLIPIDAALLPGCDTIVIDDCHHSGFVPTALDSIRLPETYEWYGSPSKLQRWADALV